MALPSRRAQSADVADAAAKPRLELVGVKPATATTTGDLTGIVHILTCGSVDDGKSTLIGRMLWDATDLYDDQRALLERSERRAADTDLPDFSLLLDGLVAEREQGITIDIAWRYFDTATRRFVVIDSPGHEQYTRNMASGASHADVAILLIDARHGIKQQTRRHAAILDLMGVKRVILAVNKMDLVDWSEVRFSEIAADFRALTSAFAFGEALAIPVCAVSGDNVARRSTTMAWYEGPFLLEYLEETPTRGHHGEAAFRLPVQTVLRDGRDFRGLAGTIRAGTIAVGDRVIDVLSGRSANVKRIAVMGGDLERAESGAAIALQLDADIDVSRGAILSKVDAVPVPALSIDARLVWLAETGFDPRANYLVRTATDLVPVSTLDVTALVDLETLVARPSGQCGVNDIVDVRIDFGRRTALDTFRDNAATGAVLLVDAVSGASLAAGVVLTARTEQKARRGNRFALTRDLLARGLCRDLGASPEDSAEFDRRLAEVTLILRAAGIDADIETSGAVAERFDPVI